MISYIIHIYRERERYCSLLCLYVRLVHLYHHHYYHYYLLSLVVVVVVAAVVVVVVVVVAVVVAAVVGVVLLAVTLGDLRLGGRGAPHRVAAPRRAEPRGRHHLCR